MVYKAFLVRFNFRRYRMQKKEAQTENLEHMYSTVDSGQRQNQIHVDNNSEGIYEEVPDVTRFTNNVRNFSTNEEDGGTQIDNMQEPHDAELRTIDTNINKKNKICDLKSVGQVEENEKHDNTVMVENEIYQEGIGVENLEEFDDEGNHACNSLTDGDDDDLFIIDNELYSSDVTLNC